MKVIIAILCVVLFALGSARLCRAQNQLANSSASSPTAGGNREHDKLNGQVRRVRVETASLLVKEGKTVEAARTIREITTYDQKGQRIDFVAYPAERLAVVGKKEYLYDAKGNAIEMVLRGDDGSILNKEKYDYQFDEFGNWKKMTASIAMYENGIIAYEPFEITYRTITYYYAQPAPKVTAPTVPPIANTNAAATASPGNITKSTTDAPVSPAAVGTTSSDLNKTSNAAAAIELKAKQNVATIIAPTAVTPKEQAATPTAIRVSEEAHRNAPLALPQPKHSDSAGNGTSNELRASQSNQAILDSKGLQPAHFSEANPKPTSHAPEPEASFYAKGVALLAAGRNFEAAEALTAATQRDPNDAAANAKLGVAYTALKQYEEAVVVLKRAIRIKPEVVDAEAYYQLSNAYTALGKFPQALEAIKQAVFNKRAELANPDTAITSRSPSIADLRYATGLAYYNLRRYGGAIEELNEVIALKPNFAQAYYGLALAYLASGDRNSAQKQQGILDSLDPVYAAKIAKLLSSRLNVQQGFGFVFKTSP